jgi:hypothetical protein
LNQLLAPLAISLLLAGCTNSGASVVQTPSPSPEKTLPATPTIVRPPATATMTPDPPTPTPSPTPTPQLAELLLAGARHLQGDPQAPVTFIEFSDFK